MESIKGLHRPTTTWLTRSGADPNGQKITDPIKKVPILSTPSERGVSNGEPLSTSKLLPAVCDLWQDVEDAPVSVYMRKIEHLPTRVLSGNIT